MVEWCLFTWPSAIYNPDFKVTIIQHQITRKRYHIELYLQWPTNRKRYINRMVPFSITLNNPNPGFKVMPFFDAEYVRNGMRYKHSFSVISNDLEWLSKIFNDMKHRAVSLWQLSYLFACVRPLKCRGPCSFEHVEHALIRPCCWPSTAAATACFTQSVV